MYGKKKMMGGGKMPKPMMKKGGKMSALVIMAKPTKKAAVGADMTGPEKPKKTKVRGTLIRTFKNVKENVSPVNTTKSELAPMPTSKITPEFKKITPVPANKKEEREAKKMGKTAKKFIKKLNSNVFKAVKGAMVSKVGQKAAKAGKKAAIERATSIGAKEAAGMGAGERAKMKKGGKMSKPMMRKGGKMKSC